MEKLDWKLREAERERIVNDIKTGKIDLPLGHSKVKLNNFPPISNGGNEIMVEKYEDGIIKVSFFIDRGFLDHWSEYTYTNNSDEKQLIESRIAERDSSLFFKIKENWYRVNGF